MSEYKMTKEQKLIQEIYDLTLQNNTARELDDAFLQGIDMAVGHLIELNLLRLHDDSNRISDEEIKRYRKEGRLSGATKREPFYKLIAKKFDENYEDTDFDILYDC